MLANSQNAKTITDNATTRGLFFPKNTAASAVHPLPPDIPGTYPESLRARTQPANAPLAEATIQEIHLYLSALIP